MSISQILCEGVLGSPDVRVLSKLLTGLCEIKPEGSKYGMGEKILLRRSRMGESKVFGIIDRDFDDEWKPHSNRIREWKNKKGDILFGWKWERKEIENYLIDPTVVQKALNEKAPDMSLYKEALESVKDYIALYQAARIALSVNRIKHIPLPTSFGVKRGKPKHPFPDNLQKDKLYEDIKTVVREYRLEQPPDEKGVIDSFEKYIPECSKNGSRYENYMIEFSGKDLLWAMNKFLLENFKIGAWEFREKVLIGIRNAATDISNWLDEWKDLRNRVESFNVYNKMNDII